MQLERNVRVPRIFQLTSVIVAARTGIIIEIMTSIVLLIFRILLTGDIVGLNSFQIFVGVYGLAVAIMGLFAIFFVSFPNRISL